MDLFYIYIPIFFGSCGCAYLNLPAEPITTEDFDKSVNITAQVNKDEYEKENLAFLKDRFNFNSTNQVVINFYYNQKLPEGQKLTELNIFDNLPENYKITSNIKGMSVASKLHMTKKTWNEARKTCITEKGHLAIISSEDEENQFRKMMDYTSISEAWLGLHDLFKENDWTTVLNQQVANLDYVHWKINEPNNCRVYNYDIGIDTISV